MKKILLIILAVAVIILGGLVIARNMLVKTAVIKGVEAATGMAVDIKSINIGLLRPGIAVSGLKVYNPAGFKDKLLADIPGISVDINLLGLLANRVHLKQLVIDVKELILILNESGKFNLNSLALFAPKPAEGKPPEIRIDELRLKIGKVAYKGYFPAVGIKSAEFDLKLDEIFYDVANPSSVAADIMKKILDRAGLSGLANFDIKAQAGQVKEQAQQAFDGIIQKAKEDLKSVIVK
ncbi:MAG: AsmA family protein [Candidatus Omnitrophica bacterium]|nr:AsmA family protein [Candidatus Omnitrophota bacterium]